MADILVVTVDTIDEILLPLREEPIVYTKILSFSVAAGFAGVPLMESVSQQLQSRLSDDEIGTISKQLQSRLSKDEIETLSKQLQSKLSKDEIETLSQQLHSRLTDDEEKKESTSSTETIKTIDTQAVAMVRKKDHSSRNK